VHAPLARPGTLLQQRLARRAGFEVRADGFDLGGRQQAEEKIDAAIVIEMLRPGDRTVGAHGSTSAVRIVTSNRSTTPRTYRAGCRASRGPLLCMQSRTAWRQRCSSTST
jgi:hypothetical protein